MNARITTAAVLALGLVLGGCGDDEESGDESERAFRAATPGASEPPPRTPDGYDIIFSNPSAAGRAADDRRAAERERQREELEARLVREPNGPDPHEGSFTLEEAVEGLPIDGELVAEINTDLGTIFCDLHADRVPNTVANFIGLARGKRAWWDARAGQWVTEPAYRMSRFHRVIPNYMIQGGDYLGDGSGTVGYTIEDEIHESLTLHDRAGQLCMAPPEANKNGAQFFITDGPAAQLDGSYTIFGQCRPEEIIANIARVPQTGDPDNAPLTDIVIEQVRIRRVEGGAAQARRTPPQMPEGFDPDAPARGASPGPTELRQRREQRIRELREAGRLPPGFDDGHGH
jgi:peptidyl-prolyl cis-trans isomerase A (cyclophilin A)